MERDRIRVAVLFGGRSCEHEVSVISARSVVAAIPRDKYEVVLIGISKDGRWYLADDESSMLAGSTVTGDAGTAVTLDCCDVHGMLCSRESGHGAGRQVDVFFPLLHGPYGEDGTVQGLLELANVAYVGAGVTGSAVGMDKQLARRVFQAANLPQLKHVVIRRSRWEDQRAAVLDMVENRLTFPVFVKPACMGSSIGVGKARTRLELEPAMDDAAQYDVKIMVEEAAENCREVEVSILGNEAPQASVPGEIVPGHEFYDYQAKYVDDSSQLVVPARITPETATRIQKLAIAAFHAVDAAGLSRVDFFVRKTDEFVYLNEINTMPGFTPISMYPKLWQASGIGYADLVDRLIGLAMERWRETQRKRIVL